MLLTSRQEIPLAINVGQPPAFGASAMEVVNVMDGD
jgi:hypothetical protein